MDRFIVGFLAFFLGMILMGVIDNRFEDLSCRELEEKIGINLAYTYNDGCVRAEDL